MGPSLSPPIYNRIDLTNYLLSGRALDEGDIAFMGNIINDKTVLDQLRKSLYFLHSITIMNSTNLTDSKLAVIEDMKHLTELNIIGCPNITGAFFDSIGHLQGLQSINLRDCKGLHHLNILALADFKNLKTLTVSCTNINDNTLTALRERGLPKTV